MAFNKAKALQTAERLVIQGKISHAIKLYFDIFEKDPSDVVLLNTIGDLYIRDRNVAEGLKQFYRLAEAYVRDQFNLKAIAIYKKIVKLEPDSVEPLLKLVELYQAQRLGREARELYYQIAEYYKKKKQNHKVLEALRKVVQLDAENAPARARLAAFCEEIGHKDEATQVYLETAQVAFRRQDTAAAQMALKKAQELDPDNPQVKLLRAREALALKHPEEVEAILGDTPRLKDDPDARSLLMHSYLAIPQPEKAAPLALEVFRANPVDFSPLAAFVSVCVETGRFDTASEALSALADELIRQGKTSSLMESLRLIWSKSPQHLPTLNLVFRICEETGDQHALPEILEALGRAYEQCGQFEEAQQAFQRLVGREPANERYKVLLGEVIRKQGRELGEAQLADLSSTTSVPSREEAVGASVASAFRADQREAMVKEALENSELLAHYHLVRKAVAELDKVLEIYPDETEIYKRLLGICWKDMPERAEEAAQALVRIYTGQGDVESAKRFAEMAGERKAAREGGFASEPPLELLKEPEAAPAPHISSMASAGVTFDLALAPEQESPVAAPTPIPFDLSVAPGVELPTESALGMSLDLSIPPAPKSPPRTGPSSEIQEIDLSEDWESYQAQTAIASPAEGTPQKAASFDYDDSRVEVNFYLEHGFLGEARKAVEELEGMLPGDLRVAELRALVEGRTDAWAGEVPDKQPFVPQGPPQLEAVAPPAGAAVEPWGLSGSHAAPKHGAQPAAPPLIVPREEGIPTAAAFGTPPEATTNLLFDLAEAFGSAMGGLEEPSPLPALPSTPTAGSATRTPAPTPAPASPLSGLLEEIGETSAMGPVQEDDPETHYNLGVAFREMNLLDEAIGEFQKVVKGGAKRPHPPNYLQACILLALCFMDKGMAPLAVKWYSRALETSELDEEALLALQYDLGVAYEQAGDLPRALEKFTEVYGQNIDFRDVAEKIRTFQQKGS